MRLLLVEDEARLGALLQATLTDSGFAVDRVTTLGSPRRRSISVWRGSSGKAWS